KDICGEALSVAAGPFKKGGEAIAAFVEAQALLYFLNRERTRQAGADSPSVLELLEKHQSDLRNWILKGFVKEHRHCDLSQIGTELLPSFQARMTCPGTAIALSITQILMFYIQTDVNPDTSPTV